MNPFFGPKMNELMSKMRESGWADFGSLTTSQFAREMDKRLGIKTNHMLSPEDWAKSVLLVMR